MKKVIPHDFNHQTDEDSFLLEFNFNTFISFYSSWLLFRKYSGFNFFFCLSLKMLEQIPMGSYYGGCSNWGRFWAKIYKIHDKLDYVMKTVKIFLFQTVKIFLYKLSNFSISNCQNFLFPNCQIFFLNCLLFSWMLGGPWTS
jgi:hypothetical protein